MGITLFKLKKWYKMLTGTSISHVNQGVGTCYSKTEVSGYYNDLTEKVTKDDPAILVPKYTLDSDEKTYFSIGIFQYGLAAYDLFLKTGETTYREKMLACADWAVENQQENGGWITFAHKNPMFPYSAMAQGEGISLLIRAHIVTRESKYQDAAKRAKPFMMLPLAKGGTAEYVDNGSVLHEYTCGPAILNGWIFSLWGLYDYCKYFRDPQSETELRGTLDLLKRYLPDFDSGFWSKYNRGRCLASPFYHKLHIAQLLVMYDLFNEPVFQEYADRWMQYQASSLNSAKAFVIKAMQKIVD